MGDVLESEREEDVGLGLEEGLSFVGKDCDLFTLFKEINFTLLQHLQQILRLLTLLQPNLHITTTNNSKIQILNQLILQLL